MYVVRTDGNAFSFDWLHHCIAKTFQWDTEVTSSAYLWDRRWLCRSRAFWSRRDVCPDVSWDRRWLCRSRAFFFFLLLYWRQLTSVLIAFTLLPTSYFFPENLLIQQGVVYIIWQPCYTSTWLYIRYNYYAIGLHAIPGLVDRRPSQPASGISASHTNPHKMLLHWMHSPDTLRIYTSTHFLNGTVLLMVRDRYGLAPGMSTAQTNKNIVASCLCWYGTVRDRYGIAPGVTQTNKQTNEHQTRELGRSGPYAMPFCLDDLDKKSIEML